MAELPRKHVFYIMVSTTKLIPCFDGLSSVYYTFEVSKRVPVTNFLFPLAKKGRQTDRFIHEKR